MWTTKFLASKVLVVHLKRFEFDTSTCVAYIDSLALFVSPDLPAKVSLQKNQCQIEVANLVFFERTWANCPIDSWFLSKDAFESGFVQLRQFSTQGTIFWAWYCLVLPAIPLAWQLLCHRSSSGAEEEEEAAAKAKAKDNREINQSSQAKQEQTRWDERWVMLSWVSK